MMDILIFVLLYGFGWKNADKFVMLAEEVARGVFSTWAGEGERQRRENYKSRLFSGPRKGLLLKKAS